MRAVLQRVSRGCVGIEGQMVSEIGRGVVVLLGVTRGDSTDHARALARKCANLRMFEDSEGKMNLSLLEVGGQAMVVSQFTLCADCTKGRRPSFTAAADPADGEQLYRVFGEELKAQGVNVAWGRFGERMDVVIHNQGPVTFVLDVPAR
jgi:D-tyrosyl-tRNA(Tyr) deacylase